MCLIHEFDMVILLTKVFGLMAWFSLWVREVPSWILEMPNFTNFDKRCLISSFKTSLVYEFKYCYIIDKGISSSGMIFTLGARGPEFNSRNAPISFNSTKRVWVLYWKHGFFTNLNIIDNDIDCPTFKNLHERYVSSICQIVDGFMNSKNIVELPS